MTSLSRDLTRLFNPSSVVVVGASADQRRVAARILANLERHNYAGQVFAVDRHPLPDHAEHVHPTIEALPVAPDVAVLAVGADRCPTAIDALGRLGTRNAVVLASGFEESGETGGALADRLRQAANRYEMNLVGPNSQGIWSLPANLVMAFGSETARSELVCGPVAVISQSGSLAGAVATHLQDAEVGISYLISTGNETDLCLADYLDYVLDIGGIKVVACYIEAVRDGSRLIRSLARATELQVDVVVLPAGLSDTARQATKSHTGRMLSSARVLLDICRQHGILTVESVHELVEACRVLALCPVRLPKSPRIGMIGISGGMLALMTDSCESRHLTMSRLNEDTEAALRTILPPFSSPSNPIDVTGAILERPELLTEAIKLVSSDTQVDAVVVGLDNRGYARVPELGELGAPEGKPPKPVIEVLWQTPPARNREMENRLAARSILVADEPAEVGALLAWLSTRRAASRGLASEIDSGASFPRPGDWNASRELLESLGLKVPPAIVIQQIGEISSMDVDRIGYPVVAKPMPNLVQHKTDFGLVRGNLRSFDEVSEAVAAIRDRVPRDIPILIQAQVTGVEVLLAARTDPDWGPVLTIGSGGVYAEILDDSVTYSIPCAADYIANRLKSLRVGAVLAGYRGGRPADLTALVSVAAKLQNFFLNQFALREFELNPVIVGPEGSGVFAVDLLLE